LVDILDAEGRLARKRLVDEQLEAGNHQLVIGTDNMANGIYTLRIKLEDEIFHKKIVILK
jgi:hypothetical protein